MSHVASVNVELDSSSRVGRSAIPSIPVYRCKWNRSAIYQTINLVPLQTRRTYCAHYRTRRRIVLFLSFSWILNDPASPRFIIWFAFKVGSQISISWTEISKILFSFFLFHLFIFKSIIVFKFLLSINQIFFFDQIVKLENTRGIREHIWNNKEAVRIFFSFRIIKLWDNYADRGLTYLFTRLTLIPCYKRSTLTSLAIKRIILCAEFIYMYIWYNFSPSFFF